MAGARREWKAALVAAALVLSAGPCGLAQSTESGSLAGKLTDLHSAPVDGATVLVRNQTTGVESRTTTTKNGAFRFSVLGPGEYTLEAESSRLGRGRLESIVVDADHEARVQAAIEFAFPPPRPIRVIFRSIEPERLAVAATLETEPMLALSLRGRRIRYPAWALPETSPVDLHAALETEPLLALHVGARRIMYPPWALPETMPLELHAQLDIEPMETMHLGGMKLPVRADMAVLHGVAVAGSSGTGGRGFQSIEAAAHAVQVVTQIDLRLPTPVLEAVRNAEPVTQTVTTTLQGEQLQALPASGRRWQDFVFDAPAAASQTGGDGEDLQHGTGQQASAVTVDGVSKRLAFGGRGNWVRGRGTTMSEPGVSESAIQEVRATAGNAEADAARAAGGRLNVETRHGTNGLHGQAFLFDRQNTWGARNPFTQWVQETAPATSITTPVFTPEAYTPPDHEMTWGAGLGSHIRRDKLFWFGALDGFGRNDPGVATVRHPDQFFAQPTDLEMQVLGGRLGLDNASAMKAYSGMLETLDGLLGPAPRTAAQWTGFGRLDWEAGERHRFTLEGIGARWNSAGGGLTRVSEMFGNHSFGSSEASETWLLGRWEAFLTQNLLAVTQASVGRTIQGARPETPSTFEQGLLAVNLWGQLPQIVVDSRYGLTIGNPSRYGQGSYPDEHLYQGQESVNWVRGGLLLKAGFSLSHNADATSLLRNQTGTYTYASVGNFISDALAFQNFSSDPLDPSHQHGCDQTGKAWQDTLGPEGRGPLPCYSYYTQTVGPPAWRLSTNDWAGYVSTQWQAGKRLVASAGLRWEREQLPPPIAAVSNPELPLTQRLPVLGNNWGPRLGLAWGAGESRWPVLRLGYGMYFDRVENAVVETALTQTGSPNGDLSLFMRPTDDLPNYGGGAPPFPYVPTGMPGKVVKPGAVEFSPAFHNPEIHQGVVSLEEKLPGHVEVTASAMVSLGRRLPISIDTNFDSAVNPGTITYDVKDSTGTGPIKSAQITVPIYASWPALGSSPAATGRLNSDYQQITEMMSRANSTYEAAMLKAVRYGRKGLSFHARYTYSHAMDWNPNESTQVAGSDVLDPADFRQEYGTSDLDIRHSASVMVIYQAPWKLHNAAGLLGNGWMLSGIGNFRSGRPYTMRTAGWLSGEYNSGGELIEALGPGMNGSGGDNRVYGVGRNTFRYPQTWKADLRLGKNFNLGQMRELELLAESFNLFNHQNVTQLETTGYYIQRGSSLSDPPTLNFLTGTKIDTTAFGKPLNVNATNFYRERQIQFGLRMRF
jgi:hypothetical protein